jgi:uncharacterized protein
MDSTEVERRATEVLSRTDDSIVAAYLFGSFARGTARPASDIDVAVLLRENEAGRLTDKRFALERELERSLGREAQVVVLNQAPPDLVHRVLLDGRLLLDRDRSRRIRFEVRLRNEYFDVLPILDLYRGRKEGTRDRS